MKQKKILFSLFSVAVLSSCYSVSEITSGTRTRIGNGLKKVGDLLTDDNPLITKPDSRPTPIEGDTALVIAIQNHTPEHEELTKADSRPTPAEGVTPLMIALQNRTSEPEEKRTRPNTDEIASINFLALLNERNTFPENDPVEKLGLMPNWAKLDDNFSKSMGSKSSYYSEQYETKLIMGSSGDSNVFSLVISPGGNREKIIANLNRVLDLSGPIGQQEGIGDTMRLYMLKKINKELGIISFIETNDKDLLGDQIVISFMSKSKCITERIWPGMDRIEETKDTATNTINPKSYTSKYWGINKSTNPIIGRHTSVTYGNNYENGDLFVKKDTDSLAILMALPSDEKDMVNISFVLIGPNRLFPSVTVDQIARKSQTAYSREIIAELDRKKIRTKQQPFRYSLNNNGIWFNSFGITISPEKVLRATSNLKVSDPKTGYTFAISDLDGLKKMISENRKNSTAF